jgi:hypothetical protein
MVITGDGELGFDSGEGLELCQIARIIDQKENNFYLNEQ